MQTRVVYLEIGKVYIETLELPKLGPNEVLIQTQQASVCGSERYYYRGINVRPQDEARLSETTRLGADPGETRPEHAYPMGPLGHEGGGTILEIDRKSVV